MNRVQRIQERIGVEPDGFWGPRSIAACQAYLRKMMPEPNPWPATDEAALTKCYGAAGDEGRLVAIDVAGLGVEYEGARVRTVRVNRACAASLRRVLAELAERWPAVLGEFGGVYANRPMRGGSRPSLHARGAAIDLWPGPNGNRVAWPVVAPMPLEVMEVFAREGWLAAGAFWGRDAMHFQATR